MTRRHFVKMLLLLMVYGLIKGEEEVEAAALEPIGLYPIIQGVTTDTTTQIAIMLPIDKALEYRLRVADSGEFVLPANFARHERTTSAWVLEQVTFVGLALKTCYFFEVLDSGTVVDTRDLQTLDLSDRSTQFAFVSCQRDSKTKSETDAIWNSLIATRPAAMIWHGDQVYASQVGPISPEKMWNRYAETRVYMKFFRHAHLIPIFSMWDDHDYGCNDGDHTYEFKNEALEIYGAFFPQKEVPGVFDRGPGCSSHLKAFGQEFLLMDARFHNRELGCNGTQSQWGATGENWLDARLATVTGPIWLITGTMFFNTLFFVESFEKKFKANFYSVLEKLKAVAHPLIFVSGDIHMSLICRVPKKFLGYDTYELAASGLLSNRPVPIAPPFRRKVACVYKNNFVMIRPIAIAPHQIAVEVSAIGNKQKVHFREYLAITRS